MVKLTLTGSLVAWGDGGHTDVECGWDVNIVKFFLGKGMSSKENVN
jgi:hypothetical protein